MLKQAIGGVASEFNNTQQQGESEKEMWWIDCYELLTVLLDILERFSPQGLKEIFKLSLHYRMKVIDGWKNEH